MHNFWIAVFALIASLWVIQGLRAAMGMSRLPWLAEVVPLSSPDAPLLSIIFAARDEAEKLPAALATLLAQDYPNYEVIAVNDRSQDQTPAILHQFERISQNLKVINIGQLPPGWLGKPHALVAGFERSRGEWIVFTDADVHFAPDVLRRAVALAQQRRLARYVLSHCRVTQGPGVADPPKSDSEQARGVFFGRTGFSLSVLVAERSIMPALTPQAEACATRIPAHTPQKPRCPFQHSNPCSRRIRLDHGLFSLDPRPGEKQMDSPKTEKCAHPVCSCVISSGKYCSAQCEAMEKMPDIDCSCGHAGCKGKAH